ncbi:MAG: hypothetical protein R2849_10935 [Thermomicrobiales bacterium]
MAALEGDEQIVRAIALGEIAMGSSSTPVFSGSLAPMIRSRCRAHGGLRSGPSHGCQRLWMCGRGDCRAQRGCRGVHRVPAIPGSSSALNQPDIRWLPNLRATLACCHLPDQTGVYVPSDPALFDRAGESSSRTRTRRLAPSYRGGSSSRHLGNLDRLEFFAPPDERFSFCRVH